MERRTFLSLAAVLAAGGVAQSAAAPVSPDEAGNEAGARLLGDFRAALNSHDLALLDRMYAEEGFIQHQALAGSGSSTAGREAIKAYFAKRLAAFPDLRVKNDISFMRNDLVAAHFIWSGTHRAEYLGVPATGSYVTFSSTDILRVSGGFFIEHWGTVDFFGLLRQLKR